MISIKHLSFSYKDDNRKALKDIHLTIKAGEFVGIIGPSGAGKSTLTMALSGIIPHFYNKGAFYGEVKVLGKDTVETDCEELAQDLGSVLQDPDAQMITERVEDELAFALENQALEVETIEAHITESLELCGISHLRNRNIAELSGGQRQRVAIAAAIAQQPKILVLDEPTSELDPKGSQLVFETLKMLNQKLGMTIIIVEQKVMLLTAYCSRMLVMQQGEIVLDGATRSVLESYRQLEIMGINCPRVVTVAALLRKAHLYNGTLPINVAEACKMLQSI